MTTPDRNAPLRLQDAIATAFPLGGMTVSGLRREAARGRLAIERIAGKDFTTLQAIDEMRELCRVPAAPEVRRENVRTVHRTPPDETGSIAAGAFKQKLNRRGAETAIEEAKRCSEAEISSKLGKREIVVLAKLAAAGGPIQFREVTGGHATMSLLYARALIAPDKRHGAGYVVLTKAGQVAWAENQWRLDT